MKRAILILILFALIKSFAQPERRIISYDLNTGAIDTLAAVSFDKTINSDRTEHNFGTYPGNYALLNTNTPTEYLFEGAQFTYKQRVADYFDLSAFPMRTTVRLFGVRQGRLEGCSTGSLISTKHVLTAAHSVFSMKQDTLLNDSLVIYPVYNNGKSHPDFKGSRVTKIYKIENWNTSGFHDHAVLELEKPLGEITGWIGFGFNKDDSFFNNRVFYRFSYPGICMPELDPRPYNGDTLYFSYGIVDKIRPDDMKIMQTMGIPGESGSSLMYVENGNNYTSYGTLSFAGNLIHTRMRDIAFYSFKSIIEPYQTISQVNKTKTIDLTVFPNPTTDMLYYTHPQKEDLTISLYDVNGVKMIEENRKHTDSYQVDLSDYLPGNYLLIITSRENKYVHRVVKK